MDFKIIEKSGKMCRKYRVGYYFPDDMEFKEKISKLHAEEYSRNGEKNEIELELIDLSNEEENHFGNQCDTVIINSELIKNEKHKEIIQNIIRENETKIENGVEVRDGANIISLYHERNFQSKDEQNLFSKEYKQMLWL